MESGQPVACVAGGISVGVLYCFGSGAARRVGIHLTSSIDKKNPG